MQASSRRLIQYVGKVTLEHLDAESVPLVKAFCEKTEKDKPVIKKAEIKGSKWHRSHDDPNDEKLVLSIRFLDDNGKRVTTGHLHKDGTSNVS
ncbi:hypothetical protein J4E90_003687 [Alternaria incomplexa]|uniref:uncharacterized protein n=1 Tax=Alternaria incomplexa TaxID=1187928 RepID=UPI0022201389|nr:uncharacterized protein J4E90_003687 [Alternaria incomplexa]XP_051298490.1 uncharacterized protein J4E86_010069 [Alternaria arbusti]KAI4917180.1 hypothetical protein J4E90_003687 [Alternaria incomplexa]KAI4943122.1 hypothetical protein J4E86_010069 [Alternaria arbusti]